MKPAVMMPTRHGTFEMTWFDSGRPGAPHLALTMGLDDLDLPMVRIHSECMTGDVFGSLRCDCGEQLDASLAAIAGHGCGVLVYLRQEGRGIGLENKLRAYRLQDAGLDTIEANLALGLPVDDRGYDAALAMLAELGVERCVLLTNNPEKVQALRESTIELERIEALAVGHAPECEGYLRTKRDRMGHTIPL